MFLKFYENIIASALWKPTSSNRRHRGRAGPVGVEEADQLVGRARRPVPDLIGVVYADKPNRLGPSRLVAVGHSSTECCMHISRPNFTCICCHLFWLNPHRQTSVRILQRQTSRHIFLSTQFRPDFYFATLPDTSVPPVCLALCLPAIFCSHISPP